MAAAAELGLVGLGVMGRNLALNLADRGTRLAAFDLDAGARQIPMNVNPAQATAYIVNPFSGRQVQFAKLFMSHPPIDDRIRRLREREWAH